MKTRLPKRSAGFTLLELMIVVAVLAVVMAVAIPSVQNAKKNAAAAAAIGRLKVTLTTSEQYRVRFGSYANSTNDLVNAGMMPDLNSSTNSGYDYAYTSTGFTWSMRANPRIPGVTADNYYYVDQSGVIRFNTTGPADSTSTPVDD